MNTRVPAGLEWWRGVDGGPQWLASLPRLVDQCAQQWSLTLHDAFEPASVAFVAPALRADGTRAVLKINFPDDESEHEARALAWWGNGAVRVLADDDDKRALLLEHLDGPKLADVGEDEATRAIGDVLALLSRKTAPDAPFRDIAINCARWAQDARALPFERELVDEYVHALDELPRTMRERVVCHQDLHTGNVLAHGTRWLAIDPKPVVAERAFDVASFLRDDRGGRVTLTRDVVVRRLDTL